MKKGLGKIRKIKKKHIFLALLAVIVLGGLAKAYSDVYKRQIRNIAMRSSWSA